MSINPCSLMSKNFLFEDLEPPVPQLANLGVNRVVAVVLHESEGPEIGLSGEPGSDDIHFYPMARLRISSL